MRVTDLPTLELAVTGKKAMPLFLAVHRYTKTLTLVRLIYPVLLLLAYPSMSYLTFCSEMKFFH